MATIAQDGLTEIHRSYIDNFAVKDFSQKDLLEKYFPDIDINLRTIGMLGYVNEQISNITEDVFNTGSVLFREMFPNRAEIDESLYSHAAIFQISNIFSKPCSCTFLLVLEESAIHQNMTYDKDSGYYYFYIDKSTTVFVEDKQFMLDYDIRMRIAKKRSDGKEDYIYTASYILDEYKNSMSQTVDPYIKIRRTGGYLAMEVVMHQYERYIVYETIVNNSKINYPVIDVPFEGNLCGFDILYKRPTDSEFKTQLTPLPAYSQPLVEPFCYYQLKNTNTLRLSFNTKDTYFMPAFNSELQIILYITLGTGGEFDIYNGTDIEVITESEKYEYPAKYAMSARPVGKSSGGVDRMEMEALQSLTVESYRTALALTTDNDLMEFFNNFEYRYGNASVVFTKLRDDVRERIFSAFLILRHETDIFKTNCLNIFMNLAEMVNPEENVYLLEPGTLFRYSETSLSEGEIFDADFLRDKKKEEELYQEYLEAIKTGDIPFIDDVTGTIPPYLDRAASFAEFKKRKGIDDKLSVFDTDPKVLQEYDDPQNKKFLYVNPFLIRFKKDPNIINMYLPFMDEQVLLDFTNQNEDAFVQFISYHVDISRKFEKTKRYHVEVELSSNIGVSNEYPIIQTLPPIEDPQDPNYGVTQYVLNDPYAVVNNDLRVIFVIADNLRDICYAELIPVEYNATRNVFVFALDLKTDDHLTSDGKMRLLDEIKWRDADTGEYYMVTGDNTLYVRYDKDGNVIEENVPVDEVTDLINKGKLTEWRNIWNMTGNDDILIPCKDSICKVVTLYRRVYSEEEGGLVPALPDQTNNPFVPYHNTYMGYVWTNEYTTLAEPVTFMYPLDYVRSDLEFMDYTLKDDNGDFVYDIMDVHIRSIPLIKWDLPLNRDEFSVFLDSFTYYYKWIVDIINTRLRNVTAIDVKWYNTYGKSKNFAIGDEEEIINTINLVIRFDMWFIPGTDTIDAVQKIKYFIKDEVEKLNDDGTNFLHVSNLMRKIEANFASVDHIRFLNINNYSTKYQSVKVLVDDINDLPKSERLIYVPEILTVDLDNIIINEYVIDSY